MECLQDENMNGHRLAEENLALKRENNREHSQFEGDGRSKTEIYLKYLTLLMLLKGVTFINNMEKKTLLGQQCSHFFRIKYSLNI